MEYLNCIVRFKEVNPDAAPIVILRRFGPLQFVYEASDTDGRPDLLHVSQAL